MDLGTAIGAYLLKEMIQELIKYLVQAIITGGVMFIVIRLNSKHLAKLIADKLNKE